MTEVSYHLRSDTLRVTVDGKCVKVLGFRGQADKRLWRSAADVVFCAVYPNLADAQTAQIFKGRVMDTFENTTPTKTMDRTKNIEVTRWYFEV